LFERRCTLVDCNIQESTLHLVPWATEAEETGSASGGVRVEFEEETEEEEGEEEEKRKQEDLERKETGSCVEGYKTAGCHKKRMMTMTFRMSRQSRGEAARSTRKREEIKDPALVTSDGVVGYRGKGSRHGSDRCGCGNQIMTCTCASSLSSCSHHVCCISDYRDRVTVSVQVWQLVGWTRGRRDRHGDRVL
jgi:hypothetical protein